MTFKTYVLTTKQGRFPEFQMLSIIVTPSGRIKAERLSFVDFLSSFIKLFVVVVCFIVFFSFWSFLFPYWAVLPAGAFRLLASGPLSWGLQSGM